MLQWLGRRLAAFLAKELPNNRKPATCSLEDLARSIRVGDVLLVEGASRFSTAIKYLTQSRWSHSALCIERKVVEDRWQVTLLEADVLEGVRTVPLERYGAMHTRICRPVGLAENEIAQVVALACERLGHQYDLKNIFDLARYLVRTPPVPSRWRRTLLGLGSGDPTRAICSSLIAEVFQAVRYPILPIRVAATALGEPCDACHEEQLLRQHPSLYAPGDFDISPFFRIVKPTLEMGFDPHRLHWVEPEQLAAQAADSA